ncbi:IclR family transcriptional regulator [Cellulomonas sp. PhB143]|uniref:IclR family transcriptional regulator n=1 Tax=Cellulomonas sp. PhB143 TaxID=2485186 RepID=UPI000F47627E|nr:IclR family transcriptional regulator [Cellulomonas sp. PhB143]ROS74462.1 IclR family transcriptional regulator [Cellulomonas sp. PhB143]
MPAPSRPADVPVPAPGRRPPPGPGVVERAFALLRAFDAEHRTLALSDLARRSGTPRSSALRLARSLVDVGALERLDDGRFTVGLGLLEVAPRGHGLREVALPFMEDLFHVTRQHVLLAVRDGTDALLVERLSAHDADAVRYRVGGRIPLATTGVGLVLLAHAPHDVQEDAVGRFASGDRQEAFDGPQDLRRMLAEVRRGGFAVGRTGQPWARSTAAAPVRGPDGVVAALSVVTPSDAFDPVGSVAAVRAAARGVSRELCQEALPASPAS